MEKRFLSFKVTCTICIIIFNISGLSAQNNSKTAFWYSEAAVDWKSAIPIGNGRIGGMVFGDIFEEQIIINENSIWCGPPTPPNDSKGPELIRQMRDLLFEGKYLAADSICNNAFLDRYWANAEERSYQPFGFLHLKFSNTSSPVNYRRWLDYENAVTYVTYEQDGVVYTREAFVSAPDQIMVIHLTANQSGKISFTADVDRPYGAVAKAIANNKLHISGQAHAKDNTFMGVKFDGIVQFSTQGGRVQSEGDIIKVTDANSVTVYLAIKTDYNLKEPTQPLSHNRAKACQKQIALAIQKDYNKIKTKHIADYTSLYNRSTFEIELDNPLRIETPINKRIAMVSEGIADPYLLQIYYHYCRYLLISSSREGGLPMNLQAIWNPLMQPPWRSNFHININQQEAYWFAEQANLSECHEPMFTLTEKITQNGKETAQVMLGTKRGAAAGHRTDVWFFTAPTGWDSSHGMYVLGLSWCAQHMMEHYRFTMNKDFLRERAYPVLRENALFFVDWLVPHPITGKLVSGPSASAENQFLINKQRSSISMGPSQDQEIIWGAFSDYLEACRILNISNEETAEVETALINLAVPKIGSDGRLLEWYDEMIESELGHRHLSHLWGMMPGRRITQDKTPYLVDAVCKSLDFRLSNNYNAQGWSLGWVTCMLARLREGNKCLDMMEHQYFTKAYPNMFVDAHGFVQIGDMMGTPLAMIELLLQSHTEFIDILPALPTSWKNGKVTGLCARGGFIIDIEWKNSRLISTSIFSREGGECNIRYGDKTNKILTEIGNTYNITF
ncbi:glycoside hydrolase N-terminal domain-containing protein [Bacteroides sp. 51]|uniref:glycoside hydrolase family 95 protein n=1 Tax=Bacteroides sp. 51 TaxID=2302938 RepID=UPI0013D630D5|nr:glycoside hydrolase family 95 protein [Bacteroides sp. 51]NDV81601.1 glycoside hydrolase family 95 protein [Bacteroides sp. 51]